MVYRRLRHDSLAHPRLSLLTDLLLPLHEPRPRVRDKASCPGWSACSGPTWSRWQYSPGTTLSRYVVRPVVESQIGSSTQRDVLPVQYPSRFFLTIAFQLPLSWCCKRMGHRSPYLSCGTFTVILPVEQ